MNESTSQHAVLQRLFQYRNEDASFVQEENPNKLKVD